MWNSEKMRLSVCNSVAYVTVSYKGGVAQPFIKTIIISVYMWDTSTIQG
jgi:hypothetical protein